MATVRLGKPSSSFTAEVSATATVSNSGSTANITITVYGMPTMSSAGYVQSTGCVASFNGEYKSLLGNTGGGTKHYGQSTRSVTYTTSVNRYNHSGSVSYTVYVYPSYDYGYNYGSVYTDAGVALTVTATISKITAVGTGTTTITDNYNNTFKITATKGANGTNNTAGGPDTLKWGYDTNYSNSYTNGSNINLTVSGTGTTRTVYAKSRTTATYGDAKTSTTSKAIRQYVGPNAPTGHKLTYNKSRLTLKENWTINWTAPSTNNGCPIKGYRIRLYRKRGNEAWIKLPIYDSNGGMGHVTGVTNVSPTDYYWDRDGTSTSATIYTEYYNKEVISAYPDILPGDIVKFAVTAYTRYGADNTGDKLFKTSEAFSSEYTVRNAGIVHVKNSSGAWVEGQVNVYVNGAWKEAEVVQVKTASGSWVESN